MSTAMAATAPAGPAAPAPEMLNETIMEEARIGFEDLRRMSHDDLRKVIADRVQLLEGILREREERREALETARMASKLLNIRRERAIRIHRQVDFGSTLAAVASTVLLVAVMI